MFHQRTEIAVLGAGFAGSLMALVLDRLGWEVVLIERGTHPRFTIGESSTPLANLVLESLGKTYDLPTLLPLTKYGRWQEGCPQLACGLKRGFTFVQHERGKAYHPAPRHANELLVAASPADAVGDTHWFREHFDHFLVRQVQTAGIPYLDRTEVTPSDQGGRWRLSGRRHEEPVEVEADFLIDATGPAGALSRCLGIETDPAGVHTNSWSVYSHFTGVARWEDVLEDLGGQVADHPYHCDDAALHHVLANGWIWVLRFNNGLTSAGVAFDGRRRPVDTTTSAEALWQQVLRAYPAVGRQFAAARAVQPWVRTGRLQRRARRAAGANWVLLPHAAYFLDALFSGGIAHTLLGIERLARIFERPASPQGVAVQLAGYEQTLFREMAFLDWLIHGCYRTFGRFELLAAYTMYYFAGAVQSEEHRRFRPGDGGAGFLFSDHEPLRSAVERSHEWLCRLGEGERPTADAVADFHRRVAQDIAPFNPAGFCDPRKNNLYPFIGKMG